MIGERTPGTPAPESRPDVVSELVGVFHSPTAVLGRLRDRPRLAPFWVLIAVAALASIISLPYQLEEENRRLRSPAGEELGLTEQEIDEAVELTRERAFDMATVGAAMTGLSLLVGALLIGVMTSLAGGRTRFRLTLSIYSHVSLIEGLGLVAKLALMKAKGSIHVYTSIVTLFPGSEPYAPRTALLDRFDLFLGWSMVVLAIGLRSACGMDARRAGVVAGGYWLLESVLAVALATALAGPGGAG